MLHLRVDRLQRRGQSGQPSVTMSSRRFPRQTARREVVEKPFTGGLTFSLATQKG